MSQDARENRTTNVVEMHTKEGWRPLNISTVHWKPVFRLLGLPKDNVKPTKFRTRKYMAVK